MPLYIWLATESRVGLPAEMTPSIDGVPFRPILVDADGILAPAYAIPSRSVSGAGAAVAITIAAVADNRHLLDYLHYHYGAAPAAGTLTVEDGAGTTVWDEPNAEGPVRIGFAPGSIRGSVNTALVVTLPAGGGAVVGTLKIGYHTLPSA